MTAHKTTWKITKDCIECKINQWVRYCSGSDTLTHTELRTDILNLIIFTQQESQQEYIYIYSSFKYHDLIR